MTATFFFKSSGRCFMYLKKMPAPWGMIRMLPLKECAPIFDALMVSMISWAYSLL